MSAQAFLERQLECACMEDPEVLWRLARAYYDEADKTVHGPSFAAFGTAKATKNSDGKAMCCLQPKLGSAEKKALVDKAMTAVKKASQRQAES